MNKTGSTITLFLETGNTMIMSLTCKALIATRSDAVVFFNDLVEISENRSRRPWRLPHFY